MGLLLLFWGGLVFDSARQAQAVNGFIPAGGKHAWMTPGEGYFASAGMALLGIGLIVRWLQLTRFNRRK